MIILLLCLVAVVVMERPAFAVRGHCAETGGDHEWLHERGPDGWHLRCQSCLHRSSGLAGVWSRP